MQNPQACYYLEVDDEICFKAMDDNEGEVDVYIYVYGQFANKLSYVQTQYVTIINSYQSRAAI